MRAWLQTTAPASRERGRTSHGAAAEADQRWRRRRRRKYKDVGVRGRDAEVRHRWVGRPAVGAGERGLAGRRAADGPVSLAAAADAGSRRRRHGEHLLDVQATAAFASRVTDVVTAESIALPQF